LGNLYTFPKIFSGVFRVFRTQLRIRVKFQAFSTFLKKALFKSPAPTYGPLLHEAKIWTSVAKNGYFFFSDLHLRTMKRISGKKDDSWKLPIAPLLRRGQFSLRFSCKTPLEIASKKKWIFCSTIIGYESGRSRCNTLDYRFRKRVFLDSKLKC
jgi:hypothetical protein